MARPRTHEADDRARLRYGVARKNKKGNSTKRPRRDIVSSADLAAFKGMKILFADDDADTADSMASILGAYFGEVVLACDGEQALRLFAEARPDVVLLDIDMPRINGLEAARRIRARDADIPLAILTCHDGREQLLRAVPLGLADYLLKPVTTAGLRDLLLRCVAQLELRGRLRYVFCGGAVYYPAAERVLVAEGELALSRNEKRFLNYMLARRGRLIEAQQICRHLADEHCEELSIQGLRNLVHRLRGKIGREAILSERDLGYRLP